MLLPSVVPSVVLPVLLAASVGAVPLENATHVQLTQAVSYFIKYGHSNPADLSKSTSKAGALTALGKDIKKFQKFAGLKETGELDEATQKKLKEPRCGVKDNANRKTGRRRRYILHGTRWRLKNIRYKIQNRPTSVGDQRRINDVLTDALDTWAREANINFEKARDGEKAHIDIKFATGPHGDNDPFDGRGGTLAHAYFPIYGGDAHFDDAEPWSINSRAGSNLYVASTHEFGHSLGLSHSPSHSMMSPWYQRPADPSSRNLLADDDKLAIQALYGRRRPDDPGPKARDPGPEMRPRGGRPPRRFGFGYGLGFGGRSDGGFGGYGGYGNGYGQQSPNFPFFFGSFIRESSTRARFPYKRGGDQRLCADARLDAALTVGNESYVFQDKLYWRLTDAGVAIGYPRRTDSQWGVPSPLDAAVYSTARGRIYMFKGDKVWALSAQYKALPGYPRGISSEFPATASGGVSAAFEWDGRLHLVRGAHYWVVGGSGGRRLLAAGTSMPANIDAATRYSNGKTYLFEGQKYYRLDGRTFEVDDNESVPFPRQTGRFWFACPTSARL